jgi:hypothetical protein
MPDVISKSQFKAKALAVFRAVEATGTPVLVSDRGAPSLEIRRYQPDAGGPLAALRGTVLRFDDPLAPVGLEDWDVV